jgi:SAM-dependent methyltransferase
MPTDWEEQYQKGDTPWDKGAPSPGLVDFLATEPLRGRVLVPGCGAGHDVRAIAHSAKEVVGVDVAPSAIELARGFLRVGGERYELANLFDLPASMRGSSDWVWEHTCFCAIEPALRPAYVAAVAGALRLGGGLLAIFYLDPGNDDPSAGPPYGVSRDDLNMLFAAHFDLEREWLPARAYPGREGREWMQLLRLRSTTTRVAGRGE